jgi:hypothetical protein
METSRMARMARKSRVPWRKLNCLNPNLDLVNRVAHRQATGSPVPLPSYCKGVAARTFPTVEDHATSVHKEMSWAPKGHYYVHHRWNAGFPTGREAHGNGAPIVVRGRESRLHGEGEQVTWTEQI